MLVHALTSTVVSWLLIGMLGGLVVLLGSWQLSGLVGGLVGGLVYDLPSGWVGGLVGGLSFWLYDVLVVYDLPGGLVGFLLLMLGTGLASGLLVGLPRLEDAAQHYILRFWLARSGVFPRRAVPFLEDATARILLRRVEVDAARASLLRRGGYSFVHRSLLDYFADAYARASSASPTARSARPLHP